jgi:endonuclease I
MYFYFATRYENTVAGYPFAMFNGSNQVFDRILNLLLSWHTNDPVSAREIERNNAIYARQGNRNPFIDNPSYVALFAELQVAEQPILLGQVHH